MATAAICNLALVLGHCAEGQMDTVQTEWHSFFLITYKIRSKPLVGIENTQTRAPGGLHTFRLAQGVVDLNGFDGLPGVEELDSLRARGLVGASERLGLTVCPIYKVFKQSQRHHSLDVITGHWRKTNDQSFSVKVTL